MGSYFREDSRKGIGPAAEGRERVRVAHPQVLAFPRQLEPTKDSQGVVGNSRHRPYRVP
jgi:hypothetical protein